MQKQFNLMLAALSLMAVVQAGAQTPAQFTALQKEVTLLHANKAPALAPFVTVDPNPKVGVRDPNIVFTGANIRIVSGSDTTNYNGAPTGDDEDPRSRPVPVALAAIE
jgi:hypothetical protein